MLVLFGKIEAWLGIGASRREGWNEEWNHA